jgi:serpin B
MWKKSLPLACLLSLLAHRATALDDAARSNNQFCFSLLGQPGGAKGNDIFSPFSIWSALAMTSGGAEGETLQQMRTALALPSKGAHEAVSGWTSRLRSVKGVKLHVANRLWGQQGLPFKAEFLKLTETRYGGGMQALDFVGDAEGSRAKINGWVSDNTEGKIKDLLARGTIQRDTSLVLTNAVYFKGDWLSPFKANNTREREFTLASGKKIEAPAMSGTFAAGYMESDRLQALNLAYQGGQTAMIVVLPRQADALEEPSSLDARGFSSVLSGMRQEKRVLVQIPKFEQSAKIELSKTLSALGLRRALSDEAEFGLICERPVPKISKVFHQAWIKVAEKGTEAAAATAVVMVPRSAAVFEPPSKQFIADRPFLYFVIDERNGGIIFAGRVMDPRK